jgi:hypothetical protein
MIYLVAILLTIIITVFSISSPFIIGGSDGPTELTTLDIDSIGNVVVSGVSSNLNLVAETAIPIIYFIQPSNSIRWTN